MKPKMPASTRLGIIAILAMACAVFIPSVEYQFTNWDDDIHVTNNPAVHQLSLDSLAGLLRPTEKYMYHPLTMATFALDWKLGNGSPFPFHATNVLLHLANILLLFVFLRKVIRSDAEVLFLTAVFAVHPLQVESVAWISARKELLYAFFYLASLLAYFRRDGKKSDWYYPLSIFFFACSLFSKPTAVTLPAVIILIEFWRSKKIGIKELVRLTPFLIGAAAFALFLIRSQNDQILPPLKDYSAGQQILLVAYQLVFYPWKAALPFGLSACYAYPPLINGALPLIYYTAPAFIAAAAAAVWLMRKQCNGLLPGLVLYVLALSPVLQLVPFNNASLVSDRYVYLPIVGIAFFLYQCAKCAVARVSSYAPAAIIPKELPCGLFVLGLVVLSLGRIGVWKDSITLFSDVIAKNDRINIAYGDRANAEVQAGRFAVAVEDCDKLIEISPDNGKAYYNRGTAQSGLGLYRNAVDDFTRSIVLGYTVASVYYNRGAAYYRLGVVDSALSDFRGAKTRNPFFADAPYSIGYAMLYDRRDPHSAIRYFDSALAINPGHAEALYQKARAGYNLRLYGMAMSDLAAAISVQPDLSGDSLIARVNFSIDSVNSAISTIGDQLTRSPGLTEAYSRRSSLYLMLGDSVRSMLDLRTASHPQLQRARL